DALPDQTYFAKYQYFADRALAGHLDTDRLPDLSPGYFWFVLALRRVGASVETIRTIQIVLLSLSALALGAVTLRLGGVTAGSGAVVIVSAKQAALVNVTDLEPEALMLLFDCLALWLLFRGSSISGGAALGLSVVCRPVGLLIAIVLLLRFRRDALRILAGAA